MQRVCSWFFLLQCPMSPVAVEDVEDILRFLWNLGVRISYSRHIPSFKPCHPSMQAFVWKLCICSILVTVLVWKTRAYYENLWIHLFIYIYLFSRRKSLREAWNTPDHPDRLTYGTRGCSEDPVAQRGAWRAQSINKWSWCDELNGHGFFINAQVIPNGNLL